MQYSRELNEARASGAKTYFTGKPCKYGHLSERKILSGQCFECERIRDRSLRRKETNSLRLQDPVIRERIRERGKERAKTPEAKKTRKNYLLDPERRRKANERNKLYMRKRGWAYYTAATQKRRAKQLHASPPWMTKEHWQQIRFIYETAAAMTAITGQLYAVDHDIPVQGVGVCGLHVPWNLVVMTQAQNARKYNKLREQL